MINTFLDLFYKFFIGIANIWDWLVSPIKELGIAPIEILTGTGLIVILGIIVIKFIL